MSEQPTIGSNEQAQEEQALRDEADFINKALDVTVWRINKFAKKLLDGKPVTAQDLVRMAKAEEGSEDRKRLDSLVAEADTFNGGFLNTRWYADTLLARAHTTSNAMKTAVNDAAGVEPKRITGSGAPMSDTMKRILMDDRDRNWSLGANGTSTNSTNIL